MGTDLPASGTRAANVISISETRRQSGVAALENAFARKRDLLVRYLTYRLGGSADAHDLAQAAFLKLWERRDHLATDNLESLLFVTARNLANDLLRSQRRRNTWRDDRVHEADGMSDTASPERIVAARDELAVVTTLLSELPAKCREAFVSYKFDGQAYDEIAARMGVTESMVRKHVIRAVTHCSARLAEMEEWV